MPSKEEALSELERERNVRVRIYDAWVQSGRMTAIDARDRMDRLVAAIKMLQNYEVSPAEVIA